MLSEKPWKPERVVLLLLGTMVCISFVMMAEGAAEHYNGGQKLDEHSLTYVLFETLILHGSVLVATAVALWWFKVSWGEAFGFSTGNAGKAMLLGALGAVIFLPVGWMLQWVSQGIITSLHREMPLQEAIQAMQKADAWDTRACFIVFSILIAPAAEEILFRGVLYPAIKQLGYPRTALWGTAALFAAIHVNLPIFLPLMALGLALALLYEVTNNLLASITAHGLFNAVNVVVFYLHEDTVRQLHK